MEINTTDAAETLGNVAETVKNFSLMQVLLLVLLVVVCLLVRKIILKFVARTVERLNIEKSLHTFINSIVNILLWFIIVLIVADYIGIPVTSLLAVLSLAGLAVSLAVQGILSNLAGGIMILTAKPFSVGDFVEAGGVSGTILDIGLVYTRVATVDNKVIFVPNGEISGEKVINYTEQTSRRVDLTFSASYDDSVGKVEQVLMDVINAHPMTLQDPAPFARVSNYGSSAIDYTVRVWCATENYWTLYYDLLKQVKVAFDENNIEMTYDHINVHMMKD